MHFSACVTAIAPSKLGRLHHASSSMDALQVFINASTSDVVATTSMEALAMGKWLICAQHPCNAFVGTFSNCLIYRSPEEFSKHLEHALKEEPPALSPSELRSPILTASCCSAYITRRPRPLKALIVLSGVLCGTWRGRWD